jgi:ribosomal protein S18 acetylase RimI-like enzyme
MMREVEITRAVPGDAAAILALQKLAYESEARLYQDWSIPPLTQTLEEIEKELDSRVFLKACLAGVIVGSVRASLDQGTCAVGRLIVHPDFQHQGIGTQLMYAMEALLSDAERFELFTGERSEGNIRLYTRLGYQIFRTKKASPQVTIVFMQKWPR